MRLTNCKIIAVTALIAFLSAGCATLFPKQEPLPVVTYKPLAVNITVTEAKPYTKVVLKKGQPAPYDGIIFDKDSSKRLLTELTEYKSLKVRDQINEQIIEAYEQQRALLIASNDLYRQEIESQRKWKTVKTFATVLGIIGGFIAGALLMK